MRYSQSNPAARRCSSRDRIDAELCIRVTLALILTMTLSVVGLYAQTPPADELDDSWIAACAGAQPGTAFFDRCQEILNAGPGSGGRRSAAAIGNNIGTTASQSRASNRLADLQSGTVESRLAELKGEADDDDQAENELELAGGWSLFISSSLENTDRDPSDFENGYDSDVLGATVGLDHSGSNGSVIGFAVGLAETDTEFDAGAGNLDVSSLSLTVYGSLAPRDNFFVDLHGGYARLDYDTERTISYALNTGVTLDSLALAETDGSQLQGGITLGWLLDKGAWTITPQLSGEYVKTDIDAYTEEGGSGLALSFGDQNSKSLTTTGGISCTRAVSKSWGVFLPQFRVNYYHEFEDDSRAVPASFVGDSGGFVMIFDTAEPDRDFFTAGAGFSTVGKGGFQFFLDYEMLFGHSFLDTSILTVGVRFEL